MRTHSMSTVPSSSLSLPDRIDRASLKGFATTALACAALACAALAMPVYAQSGTATSSADAQPTAQPRQQGRHMRKHGAHDQQQWQQKRAERHQQRLAQLHEKLALTPAQDAAWRSFEQAMQPQTARQVPLDRQAMQQLTTPERIDRMQALRAQRAAAMDARGDATKAFYAQLQPTQQQTFDQLHKMGSRHAQRHGKRHGHRHGQRDGDERSAQRPESAG